MESSEKEVERMKEMIMNLFKSIEKLSEAMRDNTLARQKTMTQGTEGS